MISALNVNLRIQYDIPRGTHCWIVEELSEGRHFRQMIFSRFLKYIKTIAMNRRPSIRCLYNVIKNDVKSMTGSNIRTILMETEVDPRLMNIYSLKAWKMYQQVPLLRNLLEVRGDNWEVIYDDEAEEVATDDDISFMIETICTG